MLKLELETQTRNKSGEGKALTGKYTHYGYYAAILFLFFQRRSKSCERHLHNQMICIQLLTFNYLKKKNYHETAIISYIRSSMRAVYLDEFCFKINFHQLLLLLLVSHRVHMA